jgi:hypothetical protein
MQKTSIPQVIIDRELEQQELRALRDEKTPQLVATRCIAGLSPMPSKHSNDGDVVLD